MSVFLVSVSLELEINQFIVLQLHEKMFAKEESRFQVFKRWGELGKKGD